MKVPRRQHLLELVADLLNHGMSYEYIARELRAKNVDEVDYVELIADLMYQGLR